jgi:hypothetical protein
MYHHYMHLSARDRLVLKLLADFGLLTSRQIYELAFSDVSTTMTKRCLRRLLASHLITVLDFGPRGEKGGAALNVYRLSRDGLRLCKPSDLYRAKVGNWAHTLAVSEVYVKLKESNVPIAYQTEPDCWTTVGTVELHPDMRIGIGVSPHQVPWWVEVDLDTENVNQVRGKLRAVVEAYKVSGDHGWHNWPCTVWIVPDTARMKAVSKWIDETAYPQLFRVCTLDTLLATCV